MDHCTSVEVNETLEYSATDRTPCEVTGVSEGVHSLINVYTPLELGGRASTQTDYPTGISANTFAGCIRYVWINGMVSVLKIPPPPSVCARVLYITYRHMHARVRARAHIYRYIVIYRERLAKPIKSMNFVH